MRTKQGLVRATAEGLFDPIDFDEEEYFYYDPPLNGDMHEVTLFISHNVLTCSRK
jgi:hypothetical protein